MSHTAARHNVHLGTDVSTTTSWTNALAHWYPDNGNGTVREIIFELLSIDLATGLEWIRDVAESESVEWLERYYHLLEWILSPAATVASLHGQAQERPSEPHSIGDHSHPQTQRQTHPVPRPVPLLHLRSEHFLRWRSRRTLTGFTSPHWSSPSGPRPTWLTEPTSSSKRRRRWFRGTCARNAPRGPTRVYSLDEPRPSVFERTRSGLSPSLLVAVNSRWITLPATLRLIFFAHHGLAIIRLARPAHRCPEARELVASVVLATCQLTQRDRGVDRGVSQDTEDRQTPTADDQSQPLDPSERRLLYKSVMKTLNEIIQVNGRQQQPPIISPVLHIADTVSRARAQYKFW